MASKSVSRINPVSGVPEHRHGDRGFHWAWSSHDGQDPETDPAHVGIYVADPRSAEEIKAKRGYSSTNAAIKGTSRGPRSPQADPLAEEAMRRAAIQAELDALEDAYREVPVA